MAIDLIIGRLDRSATKMRNLDEILSIIEELEESKKKAASTCKEEDILMNIIRRRYGEKVLSQQKSKSKPKNQWITREVLGQMYLDKDFLSKFIHRSGIDSSILLANNSLYETHIRDIG
jgi:pyruvate/oxaloacetate carboxyltransferase